MMTIGVYAVTAAAEIAGCYAFWMWLREDRSAMWVPVGIGALALFAWLLTRADVQFAGRAYAAYGGIYIAASLGWLYGVEGVAPDRWDVAGASLAVAGALVILLGPRG